MMTKSPYFVTMGTSMKLLCILPLIFAPTAVQRDYIACTKFMATGNCIAGDEENNSKQCNNYCVESMDMYYGSCLPYGEIQDIVGSQNIVDENGNPIATEDYQSHHHHDHDPNDDQYVDDVNFSGLTDDHHQSQQELDHQYFDDDDSEKTYGQLIGDPNPNFWNQVQASIAGDHGGPPPYTCFCCIERQYNE